MFCETSHFRQLSIHWLWILSLTGVLTLAFPINPSHAEDRTVSFVNDVVPILTKAGCNTGLCHGKAGGGQNGFQLSLLGFEPTEDYEHIVLEGRGRRLYRHGRLRGRVRCSCLVLLGCRFERRGRDHLCPKLLD